MESIFQWISLIMSGIGVSFAFGKQAGSITALKKDVREVHEAKREILAEIKEIQKVVIRLETRLDNQK